MRERIVEIAADTRANWDDPDLANELLTGHAGRGGKPTRQPHLAIVPLPSFNSQGTADGRVRRVALIGYAKPNVSAPAAEIYDTLASALDGESISKLRGRLRRIDSSSDKNLVPTDWDKPSLALDHTSCDHARIQSSPLRARWSSIRV